MLFLLIRILLFFAPINGFDVIAREVIKVLVIWIMTDAITNVNMIGRRISGTGKRFFADNALDFTFHGSKNDGGNHGFTIPFVNELRYNNGGAFH